MTIRNFFRGASAPLAIAFTLSVVLPSVSAANPNLKKDTKLDWSFAPYVWGVDADGDVEQKGQPANVDLSLGDTIGDGDLGFGGHFEVGGTTWTGIIDVLWMNQTDDAGGTPGSAGADYDQTIVELLLARRVHEDIELLLGMRIWDFDLEVDTVGTPPAGDVTTKGTETWVDAVFGARYFREVAPNLGVSLRGDIGGFNMGSSAKFAWNLMSTLAWEIAPNRTLHVGYKALDVNHKDKAGEDDEVVKIDMLYHGPIIGFDFGF